MTTTSWKNDNPGCNCDCCNCADGYATIGSTWSQVEAEINGPLPLTAPIEFLASANGVICGDGLVYAYTEAALNSGTPNRIQFDGPTDCSNDVFGVPLFGLFLYLPTAAPGVGSTAFGPSISYVVSARCIAGVLHYCWEATLGYKAISSSGLFPNADCHGDTWYLPNMPDSTSSQGTGTRYSNTIGDETTTVIGTAWPISNGIAGFTLYEMAIGVVKAGCSTDIGDVPTSFNLAPEYNPAGISVDFLLS